MCAWIAAGTTRGNDWYAQAWNAVHNRPSYENGVLASLWDDLDVKGWLDQNIGYWNQGNPWANLEGAALTPIVTWNPGMTTLPTSCRSADVAPLAHFVADWMHHRCRAPQFQSAGLRDSLFNCGWQGIQGPERINEFVRRGYVTRDARQFCQRSVKSSTEVIDKETAILLHDAPSITNGKTVATNWKTVDLSDQEENAECSNPKFGGANPDYFLTPSDMLDWSPTEYEGEYGGAWGPPVPWNAILLLSQRAKPWIKTIPTPSTYDAAHLAPGMIGANEGRVRPELREVARRRDPVYALCKAAQSFKRNAPAQGADPSDDDFGKAFADLSVTGRHAFAKFIQVKPTVPLLRREAACQGTSDPDLAKALNRAYTVATVLRSSLAMIERRPLGWIAVSGEDDQPDRPVNVPSVSLNNIPHFAFPQFSLTVGVPSHPGVPAVKTRYTIMHSKKQTFARLAPPLVYSGPDRTIPAEVQPALAADAEVILFIHGMDSRLEEAINLTEAMRKLGGKNWTVISLDLPTSGYADNIDHRLISPTSAVNANNNRAVPMVDYLEDFIVAFVNTLNQQLPGLKSHIRAVVGGSLGGNMSMRLGRRDALRFLHRRDEDLSWIRAVAPWSPAAIWPSYANPAIGGLGHVNRPSGAISMPLDWAGHNPVFFGEKPQRRREFFYGGFDWRPGGVAGAIFDPSEHAAQADLWWRKTWNCKEASKIAARLDRQETYDENFRRWHWRLGAEQVLFSQQETVPTGHYPIPSNVPFSGSKKPPLYFYNTVPMFLSCGRMDVGGDLCNHAIMVSRAMINTPGRFRVLENTGHSIDNERPRWFAAQLAAFLDSL